LRFRLGGVADRVKLGGATIVSAMEVLLVSAPAIPVTVTVQVPGAAVALAMNVSVLVRVVCAGPNAAVTPGGRPVTESATVLLNPPPGVTARVLAPLPPWGTLTLAGEGAMV
jgi:hypothetical protein